MVGPVTLVHLSDLHFGGPADLDQVEALEECIPGLAPDAIAVSGDLTQRARHGEFQRARALVRSLLSVAPVLVIPGNHDVEWWKSPFAVRGHAPKYRKYRRYFGADLTPVIRIPGATLAGALTSHGVAFGSLTPSLRDLAVIGHLPARELRRLEAVFAASPAGDARLVVLHHNVLRGGISGRTGLVAAGRVHRRLREIGVDVVLTGHDHEEAAGTVAGTVAVSAAGTHSSRSRLGRPGVFNTVRIDRNAIEITHYRWEAAGRRFAPGQAATFPRGGVEDVLVETEAGR